MSSTFRCSARGAVATWRDTIATLRGSTLCAALVLTYVVGQADASSAQAGANDPTFNVGDDGTFGDGARGLEGWNSPVRSIVRQPDGKLVIAGEFNSYNGVPRSGIARLNSDGSLDSSFDPGVGVPSAGIFGAGVYAMALQSDGKLLIGGQFTSYNGVARGGIARLNADGGLDTSFNPGTGVDFGPLTELVSAIALQSDGKILIGGTFTSYNGVPREFLTRLNSDGSLDTSFSPSAGANQSVTSIVLQPDGKVLIGGTFTAYDNTASDRVARVNTDGTIDTSFNPGTGADAPVTALALQPDGKLLIGGFFTFYNDVPQKRLARLNPDGSLDTSFDPGNGPSNNVDAIVVQADGKLLIGGNFVSYNGVARRNFARVNPDGSLDTSAGAGAGANARLYAIAAQPDGSLLVGGVFTSFDGSLRSRIARLSADTSFDASFNPGAGASAPIRTVAMQPDGKALIGGDFLGVSDTLRSCIARVKSDGSLDASFNPGTGAVGGSLPNAYVQAIALQGDGKALIGGNFSLYNATARSNIARVNTDGSLDSSFDPGAGANSAVRSIALQSDGKVLIGGAFTLYDSVARNGIARLNSDGSLDASFGPGTGANSSVNAVALQPDSKVLVAGEFTSFNGAQRRRIARLNSDGTLDTSFDPGTGVTGGTAPQLAALALQPDGRILIAGLFAAYDGTLRRNIARVNSDGSLDASFSVGTGPSDFVQSLVRQPDGKVLIGGRFTSFDGAAAIRLARLNSDGSRDASFVAGAGATGLSSAPGVSALALQGDGRLLIGGDFTTYDGAARHRIARVFTVAPGVTTSYCTAGTSAIGCTPTMSASGVASASATSGYVVTTSNIEGLRQTNTFYSVLGPRTPATPFGAGLLCVKTPTQRIGSVQASGTPGQCNGSVSIDVLAWAQAHPGAQGMPFTLGTTLNFQCAIRDPLSPGTRVMSDALQVTLAP